jgi:hypothetical protein
VEGKWKESGKVKFRFDGEVRRKWKGNGKVKGKNAFVVG